jgi:hypothetical protein
MLGRSNQKRAVETRTEIGSGAQPIFPPHGGLKRRSVYADGKRLSRKKAQGTQKGRDFEWEEEEVLTANGRESTRM